MVENIGDVLRLVYRARLNYAAFGLILTALPYSGTLSALCSSTRASLIARWICSVRYPESDRIGAISTYRLRRMSAAAVTQIGRPVSLKWLSRRLISMPRRRSSCLMLSSKRAAQAQQTHCLLARGGDFASVYVSNRSSYLYAAGS